MSPLFEKRAGASDTLGFVGGTVVVVAPRKLGNSCPIQRQALSIPQEVRWSEQLLQPRQMRIFKFTLTIPSWLTFIRSISTHRISQLEDFLARYTVPLKASPKCQITKDTPTSSHFSADTFWNNKTSPAGATHTNSQSGRSTCLGQDNCLVQCAHSRGRDEGHSKRKGLGRERRAEPQGTRVSALASTPPCLLTSVFFKVLP